MCLFNYCTYNIYIYMRNIISIWIVLIKYMRNVLVFFFIEENNVLIDAAY